MAKPESGSSKRSPRPGPPEPDPSAAPHPGPANGGPLIIAKTAVPPGVVQKLEIPVARLPTQIYLSIPVAVVHGSRPGPRLWLSAAIHGDEVNGVEVIRQVLARLDPRTLGGAVIAVPIVNVFGFINESRYLPDRRDLNRSFPGSHRGSLTARLARLFLDEIVENSTHGVDLHTAALGRTNLPQVRVDLSHPPSREMALAFGAPVAIHSRLRDGSLREASRSMGRPVVLYEAGEPHRFNRSAIRFGVRGVLRVMSHLGMIEPVPDEREEATVEAWGSRWVRARRSGMFRREVQLGDRVTPGDRLGTIADAFGDLNLAVRSTISGVVIGMALNPLVNRGDALVHIAELKE